MSGYDKQASETLIHETMDLLQIVNTIPYADVHGGIATASRAEKK